MPWFVCRQGCDKPATMPNLPRPIGPPAEDLHHFDTASWRLLSSAVNDASLHQSVLFIVTYRWGQGGLGGCVVE